MGLCDEEKSGQVIRFDEINDSVLQEVVSPAAGERGRSRDRCAAALRANSLSDDFQTQLHHRHVGAFILN